ncbi:TRAP transporter substrate-binding protein [Paracoccus sp. S1E-3]|uniref:TRAP transporter substrate-binding protein n=1 Tax=Paracoccus sp. S1E-3 TaxID=2756130 RepID=UPI0015EEF04B|nr:TRAP transporter substrate-binding protein [Paracoccus sp. S1E-3]MBA4491694.1 TRAP transporter substrate-binding protein [Paracoccus sp. S1E-3]
MSTRFQAFTPLGPAIVAAAFAGAFPAVAQEFSFKFQSSDPAGNPTFMVEQEWAKGIEEASGGRLKIEVLPVDSVVAYNETHDSVAAGILDGHMTSVEYMAGKDPAFGLIGNTVGAWSSPDEMIGYMKNGGGTDLIREMLGEYGLYFIGGVPGGLEAFVSRVPIDTVEDLRGVKLRAPEGLVQEVFAAAGASPVNLPSSEVYTSLDKHVIDAADYSTFAANQAGGLNKIAPNPIYPGFHSMPLVEVSMNQAKWDGLPDDLKTLLTTEVEDLAVSLNETLREKDKAAVAEAIAEGVTIHDWSPEERKKFRAIAQSKWKDVAARSPNAQRVYDSVTAYLTAQGLLE